MFIEPAPANAKPLTKKEQSWLKKLEKVFADCPSDRLGLFTIGDPSLTIYDNTQTHLCRDGDICDGQADSAGISLGYIDTKVNIDGVFG